MKEAPTATWAIGAVGVSGGRQGFLGGTDDGMDDAYSLSSRSS